LLFLHIARENPNILISFQPTIISYPNPEPITRDNHIIQTLTSQLSGVYFQGDINANMHIQGDHKLIFTKALSYCFLELILYVNRGVAGAGGAAYFRIRGPFLNFPI